MRIMDFSEMWPKLRDAEFTTFRLTRRDRDWALGEQVQIVYRPRSKDRRPLCLANIYGKRSTTFKSVTEEEAIADGFSSSLEMWQWLQKAHPGIAMSTPLNKLYLRRLK